jgi:hypothetical protein
MVVEVARIDNSDEVIPKRKGQYGRERWRVRKQRYALLYKHSSFTSTLQGQIEKRLSNGG